MEHKQPPLLVVISGPSGAGKTSLCSALVSRHSSFRLSISATTRPPRKGEADGREYVFLKPQEFLSRKERGEFAEWAIVHDHYYGTPRCFVDESLAKGISVVFDIDVQGGMQIRECYPNAVLVFAMTPSQKTLRERLIGRQTDAPDVIETRMKNAIGEIAYLERFDYLLINDRLERTIEDLEAVLRAERLRVGRADPQVLSKGE